MPVMQVIMTVGILALVVRAGAETWAAATGRARPMRLSRQVARGALCVAVCLQAAMWLRTDHPEATPAFTAGVWLLLGGAMALGLLSGINAWLGRSGHSNISRRSPSA